MLFWFLRLTASFWTRAVREQFVTIWSSLLGGIWFSFWWFLPSHSRIHTLLRFALFFTGPVIWIYYIQCPLWILDISSSFSSRALFLSTISLVVKPVASYKDKQKWIKLATDTWSIRKKNAVTAKSSKRKLQAGQEKWQRKSDNPEALQTVQSSWLVASNSNTILQGYTVTVRSTR